MSVFFFFQAEDGIRASSVTGVQTCALPISVGWFLDSVALPAASNYAVFGTEGVADDLEVAAILDEADDLAARRVLQLVGLDDEDALSRAQVRAYGGLAKATAREWARRGAMTREQAHRLLRDTLLFLVDEVLAG